MDKDLKKSYNYLELPYSATIEEVKIREKALIKTFQSKSEGKNTSVKKEVDLIKSSANNIIENIKKNGISQEEYHRFEASKESIVGLIIVLLFVGMMCFFSFYLLW